jgi:hypothetical protein
MQLRSRTIATVTNDEQAPKPVPAPASKRARRTSSAHRAVSSAPDDSDDRSSDDILPLSENGVRHAIRFADHFMELNNTSLHAHFVADGRRLYRRWQECDITTRSGANSKLVMQRDFEAFVRFVQNEAGVDITEDVK